MAKEKVMQTMDGNEAAAYASYAFTEVAGIFPITPSSPMAEHVDAWSAQGKKNIFGQTVAVTEMQSEGGAAGVVHGSLAAGALTTTYTASQGLLLMIPNMYKIAGELLPGVLHVSARALASHALSIFGDHSDVMACRQTGFAFLASTNVQEIIDLGAIAHLSAIRGRVPFVHFFDGFRTSHEMQKVELTDYDVYASLVDRDALKTFRDSSLSPEHPTLRGTAQNPDIFFQAREASNKFYEDVPGVVQGYMDELGAITGRRYKLFDYYGDPEAERVIVAMGSVCDCAEETIDYLTKRGEKIGLIKVRLYRPFSADAFVGAVPKTVKSVAVLDRTKEPGSIGEPLYQDILTAFIEKFGAANIPTIVAGRYGLGSKDTTPGQIKAVFDNLKEAAPKRRFTLGIVDDVTHLSLPLNEDFDPTPPEIKACKFWGLGSDGTVGANKNSIKIIGNHTDMCVQAYFSYDSKKSGGITVSHLRFGSIPIKSTYFVNKADFVACHNQSYVDKYDMVEDLKDGGVFLLNTQWSAEELSERLPAKMRRYIAEHKIRFYTIDGISIGHELGLGSRINLIMQAAFFKLAEIIPIESGVKYMKYAATSTYGNKGKAVVEMNLQAIDRGVESVAKVDVPADWADAEDLPDAGAKNVPSFVTDIMEPMNAQQGHKLPVSAFIGREDGTFPQGTTKYEKRGVAVDVPEWLPENCIQCNQCSFVCPHAAIRPFLLDEDEQKAAPQGYKSKKAIHKGAESIAFSMQLSPLDCYGCGNCVDVCPAKVKALKMVPAASQAHEAPNWEYALSLKEKPNTLNAETVKGSQFQTPLLEFSGACAGCGETPYAKLITQLFGDRMMVANATGCSSIWGGSAPSQPYTTNAEGKGPAWANSLFEDNAEYGLGMFLASKQIRARLYEVVDVLAKNAVGGLNESAKKWMQEFQNGKETRSASSALLAAVESYAFPGASDDVDAAIKEILEKKDYLVKRSQWIFGGDGWAYDIGYGGLDHVLATGEDVNLMVFDTEVYSNTGGQSSKSTPIGAVAQFAAAGKATNKKDLGLMCASYGYVYVAQIAMGANQSQALKAIVEAENYPGPSLVIAYAPCINHGIRVGMGCTQREEKLAVEAGYWHLYRYNPLLKAEGKNPFTLDSKDPTGSYRDFLMGEVRYSSLTRSFPDRAKLLFENAEEAARARLDSYKRMAAAK